MKLLRSVVISTRSSPLILNRTNNAFSFASRYIHSNDIKLNFFNSLHLLKPSFAFQPTQFRTLSTSTSTKSKAAKDEDSTQPTTGTMRQYNEVKKNFQDAILLFQLGDFYQMFQEDAVKASNLVGLTLTKKNFGVSKFKQEGKEPPKFEMCGFPKHSLDSFLPRFVKHGLKVAICDQVEDPKTAKFNRRLVKREVVRVVTPGTLFEEPMLNPKKNNFLLSISFLPSETFVMLFGLSWVDISTGHFHMATSNRTNLLSDLTRIRPSEILISSELAKDEILKSIKRNYTVSLLDHEEVWKEKEPLKKYFELVFKDKEVIKQIKGM
eukprot:TRINITY_DN14255_c0_g1_i1.p1 TRINITY_DN14255_c0_g1~~TRINITY_DN14255_c0_g1_i1.p1  ORF type:complete len:323 (+),score=67.07 TRINITY_DN14255_c0_g1_i1:78-1046(+)